MKEKSSGCTCNVWGILAIAQIALVIAKLLGAVTAPWFLVLIPLWIMLVIEAVIVLFAFFCFVVAVIVALVES